MWASIKHQDLIDKAPRFNGVSHRKPYQCHLALFSMRLGAGIRSIASRKADDSFREQDAWLGSIRTKMPTVIPISALQ
jgi:hypothetical protein